VRGALDVRVLDVLGERELEGAPGALAAAAPVPHLPLVTPSYSANSRKPWKRPCIISWTMQAWISS
jgi:hypothetical protein